MTNTFEQYIPKNLDNKAMEWHMDVYCKMSDTQKAVIDHFYGATSFVAYARDAYEVLTNPNINDDQCTMTCGSLASCALKQVRILKDLLKLNSIQSTLKKLQEIHDYFTKDERFPFYLPEPVDSEGSVHYKTVRGTYDDMWRFQEQMIQFKKSKEAQIEEEERRNGYSGSSRR